jgi:formate dehydrogenase iron-sulfur subunit
MESREQQVVGLPQSPPTTRGALLERLLAPFRRGPRPIPKVATGFYTDTTVCIGCKACEVACKQWNQLPADEFRWSGNSYDNTETLSAASWRHVKFVEQFPAPAEPASNRLSLDVVPAPAPAFDARWLMMSDVCKHCATAPCQQACPTGSLIYNEFGNVYIQPDICNGCAYCIAACPFGVITRSTIDGHAHKCTLCFDRQADGLVPACAKACPTESIQFGPLDELHEKARRRVEQLHGRGVDGAYLYGDRETATYSALNSFYLLVDRPEVYGLPAEPFNPWLHMAGDYARAVAGILVAIVLLLAMLYLQGQ